MNSVPENVPPLKKACFNALLSNLKIYGPVFAFVLDDADKNYLIDILIALWNSNTNIYEASFDDAIFDMICSKLNISGQKKEDLHSVLDLVKGEIHDNSEHPIHNTIR